MINIPDFPTPSEPRTATFMSFIIFRRNASRSLKEWNSNAPIQFNAHSTFHSVWLARFKKKVWRSKVRSDWCILYSLVDLAQVFVRLVWVCSATSPMLLSSSVMRMPTSRWRKPQLERKHRRVAWKGSLFVTSFLPLCFFIWLMVLFVYEDSPTFCSCMRY